MAVANVASLHGDERWFEDPKTFRIDRFMDGVDHSSHLFIFGKGANMVSLVSCGLMGDSLADSLRVCVAVRREADGQLHHENAGDLDASAL